MLDAMQHGSTSSSPLPLILPWEDSADGVCTPLLAFCFRDAAASYLARSDTEDASLAYDARRASSLAFRDEVTRILTEHLPSQRRPACACRCTWYCACMHAYLI